jgi:hypothetical protein
MELGKGRKQCSAGLLDEARVKGGRKLLELSARKSQTLGELPDVTILHPAASPKQKSHSANSKPLADGTISHLLTIFLKDKSVNSS